MDVVGGPPATAAEVTVQAEHWLNIARHIRKMAMRIDHRFLATSNPLQYIVNLRSILFWSVQ